MAKQATKNVEFDDGYENQGRKPDDSDKAGSQVFKTRDEEEAADRERLKVRAADLTPERVSELMTEITKLDAEYSDAARQLREQYSERKKKLQEELGAGAGHTYSPVGPQPTNETLADGSPRSRIALPA
jgi:hypothetical protein